MAAFPSPAQRARCGVTRWLEDPILPRFKTCSEFGKGWIPQWLKDGAVVSPGSWTLGTTKAAVLGKSLQCQRVLCSMPEDMKFEEYQTRNCKTEWCWPREYCSMSSASSERWKKSRTDPKGTAGGLGVRGLSREMHHQHPPKGPRGDLRRTQALVGAPCRKGCSPAPPPPPAPQAAPQTQRWGRTQTQGPWNTNTEASWLSPCSLGRLRCLSTSPWSPHLLGFSASPSGLPAAAHPDAHQYEGLFASC